MNTQTMIEKVARAICEATICDPGTVPPEDMPALIAAWWPESLPAARAALQALREPTEEMVNAADALDPSNVPYSPGPPDAVFTAMIDVVLQEERK